MNSMQMRNPVLAAVPALSVVLLALPALAQAPASPPGGGYWHHDSWGWGHMLFGSLMMILFWGGLILLIALAVRYFGQGSADRERAAGVKTPRQILEERFARGEIDKDEFEQRRQALSR
jgi:putative membrane protein